MNGTKVLKYSLLTVDVIILLTGFIMLIAGSVGQGTINSDNLSRTIGGYSTQAGTIICILFGLAIMGFGVLGIYATSKDSHALLILYGSTMSIIFLIQLITGIIGLSVRNSSNFNTYVENVFKHEFVIDSITPGERDFYQRNFACCGWQSLSDYMNTTTNVLNAPKSCCAKIACDTSKREELFQNGCNLKLIDASRLVIETACSILVTFSLINLISIVVSFVLARQIKNGYNYT